MLAPKLIANLRPQDMELFYNDYGEDGPPMIILHGLLGASGNWHTLSRTVFSEVAHVYAVDQRNHGRSPHSDRFDYDAMAADVKAFAERHDLGAATLLGHSMGGKTAMTAALQYPELVDRLIVVDMAPRKYPPQHRPLLDALQRIDPSEYADRQAIDDALSRDVESFAMRQFLLKNLAYDTDAEAYSWQMNLDAIIEHYDAVNAPVTVPEGGAPYDGPALFVRGGASPYVRDADADRIRELFPRAELQTIEGAGHWVHAEKPDALAEAVTGFLRP